MRLVASVAALLLASCSTLPRGEATMAFDAAEIRQAERALEVALSSPDPVAWVDHCTEDAVFVAPGAPAVQGREALARMAKAMHPLPGAVARAGYRRRLDGGCSP